MTRAASDARRSHAIKVLTIVGARPQFIKAFPLSRALRAMPDVAEISVHTGQHFDPNMSDIFFEELGIARPEYELGINGGGQGDMTGRMLIAVEEVLIREEPDVVVVYGDTNSTTAGALAAAKLRVPLAHVEAGLRSYNRAMPEEINRVVADHLSNLLLCPTATAVENLAKEGITRGVVKTGDLMYDAALIGRELAVQKSSILATHKLIPKAYAVATIHRAENTDSPEALARVLDYLEHAAREQPIIMPVHPRTRIAARNAAIEIERPGIQPILPLGYLDMCQLVHNASSIFTDSGGLQKEAYFHGIPCVTLRGETEWVETVANGWNRLWHESGYASRHPIGEYGNGHAAAEIAQSVLALAGNHRKSLAAR